MSETPEKTGPDTPLAVCQQHLLAAAIALRQAAPIAADLDVRLRWIVTDAAGLTIEAVQRVQQLNEQRATAEVPA